MSHKNKASLVRQVQEALQELTAYGQSKHLAKQAGTYKDHIYSYSTFKVYMQHCNYFVAYCKAEHACRTLEECRPYVNEWLEARISAGLSAYTLKLEAAALAKLYRCSTADFRPTPARERAAITRSRGAAVRDKGFSEARNSEIIAFCHGTGLRRAELAAVRGADLRERGGRYYIYVKGKGGRERYAPVLKQYEQAIVSRMQAAGGGPVWGSVPSHMDVHAYRAEYATAIYRAHARDPIPAGDKYYCRGDRKGVVMDRLAMLEASRALGHNRISVVAAHYIR